MKKIVLLFTLLLSLGISAMAQLKPLTDATYVNFTNKNEVWVCTTSATPIDMAYNAFGKALPTGSSWIEITPGTHLDGSAGMPTSIIDQDAKNVFNPSGRTPGVYEYVYINQTENFCQMPVGAQSIFRIYLVPNLDGYSANNEICPTDNGTVDLSANIPTDVKNFATAMGWTFSFYQGYPGGAAATMPVTVNSSTVGTHIYSYRYNDAAGNFAGKFAAMVAPYKCDTEGKVTHTITLRQDAPSIPATTSRTYCYSNVASIATNLPTYTVNLNSILTISAIGGTWSTTDAHATVTTAGVASINMTTLATAVPHTINFTYTYNDCSGVAKTATVALTFGTDNEVNPQIVDGNSSICRNFSGGSVNLINYFGLSVPATLGTWVNVGTNQTFTGIVDVSTLTVGTSYQYRYIVSPAADAFCNVSNYRATLTLAVKDANAIAYGETQLCKSLFETGTTQVNLSSYVAGLSLVSPADVKWYEWDWNTGDYKAVAIANPAAYTVAAPQMELGVNKFKFVYTSDCGSSDGLLYYTITDHITNFVDKTITYCFTDANAQGINLFQVLGVSGLTGTWTVDPSSDTVTPANLSGSVFNASAEYGNVPNGTKTYVFTYTSPAADGCTAGQTAKITVILTPTI